MDVRKRIQLWITVIFVMLVFVGYGGVSHAETYVCGDYEYEVLANGKARIVGYTGDERDVLYIPDTLDGHMVGIVGKGSATGGSIDNIEWNAKEIHIPEGVTTIYGNPFTNDQTIKDIYIPSSVTVIDEMFGCPLLENIHVDEDNQKYCDVDGVLYSSNMRTLYRCPKSKVIKEYEINEAVQSIAENAFSGCDDIQSIIIPSGVTEICKDAFYGCNGLKAINIPGSVKAIGDHAFYGCKELEQLNINDGVRKIGFCAFDGCTKLTEVYIPQSVKVIDRGAFRQNGSLERIVVDEENAKYCSEDGVLFTKDMKTLCQYPAGKEDAKYRIPDGVKEIRELSFGDHVKVERLEIPESVMTIDKGEFSGCFQLEYIDVEDANQYYYDLNGVLFSTEYDTLLYYPQGRTQSEYAVPYGVQIIARRAFDMCKIRKIVIPNSVREMEWIAISCSDSLEEVVLPSILSVIDNSAIWTNDKAIYYVEKDSYMEKYVKSKGFDYDYIAGEDIEKLVEDGPVLINEYVFPDAAFRSVAASYDNNGDRCLTRSERDDIVEIRAAGKDITDMSGIEYFSNLKSLDCHDNNIHKMDLSDNALLEKLFCYNNKINSLLLNNNANISVLYCWNNSIEAVDIQSLSEERMNSLMYNFETSSEQESYGGAYRSYVTWGGNVALDKENKKLVINNPDPSEFIENYNSYDTWEFQYSGKSINLTNYKLYYNKNEVDEKLLLYNTDFTCEGFAPVGESSEEKWGGLEYKSGIPADTGTWVLALKSEKLRGVKYIKAVIKKQDNDPEDDGEGNKTPSVEENSKEDNTSSVTQKSEGDNTSSANEKDKNTEDNTSNKEQSTVNSEKSKQPAIISAKSYKKTYGDKAFDIGAATNSDAVLKFTSSNSRVVTVSDKGRAAIKGCGKAYISIESPETADYEANIVTITVTVVPGKVTFKKVKSPKKSQIYFSWKKLPGVTGYQYNVSSKKSFKGAKLYSTNAAYKKLVPNYKKSRVDSSGGRFYIRIRAYVKIDKKTYYGKWSKVKTIRVK